MSSTNTGSPENTGADRPASDMSEVKAKMRAALERKNAGEHPTAEGVTNTGAVHGQDGVSDAKRTFQPRKTG